MEASTSKFRNQNDLTRPKRRSFCFQLVILRPSVARAARAYTGLTVKALGELAGVASRTVHRLEHQGNVSDKALGKILGAFAEKGIVWMYDEFGRIEGMILRCPDDEWK